ncbi:hypothetical protein RB195_010228 [Necator americanus]|uniref:Uncharacterized protein n=2 Tax=Necator americanus TaxID=51031 RepID=A0ABR1CXF3_NECAM|nr:hypothetical protein NECAME_11339 [Necator americanus]ETN77038.1 hypothetical protein NECAME_11339 [Necator americanus]
MLLSLILFPVALAESFWMTAELLRVDWREGCLTTAGCSQPRFKLLEDMLPLTEKISISWPVSEHFVQDSSRSFVSHWANGKPEDVTLSCQVVGTDPTYGFPRVCDQTASIRIFQDGVVEAFGRNRRHQTTTTAVPEDELGKKLIEIRAKCFNATVAVQKHTERCPWCPDPSDVTLIEQRLPEDVSTFSASILSQLKGDDRILHVSVLVLAGIAILASLGFACVLVAFLRQKRTHRQISVKPRYQPYSPSSCKTADDENRYDMPWEQTRPLTYWLSSSSKSEATTTSPLDSASSLGAQSSIVAPYTFRSGCTIPQTHLYHHISPNSSIGPGHDSGLESV